MPKRERWPYTAAAVIFMEKTDEKSGSAVRKLHIVDILLDQTKVPTFEGGAQLAEVLHQVLHAFIAAVAQNLDQSPETPGQDQGETSKPGETPSGVVDRKLKVVLPKCIMKETWPEHWRPDLTAAIENVGFVKGESGWVHSFKQCSKCGACDVVVRSCSGCKRAHYCSKECQRAAWGEGHREECREARATAAST